MRMKSKLDRLSKKCCSVNEKEFKQLMDAAEKQKGDSKDLTEKVKHQTETLGSLVNLLANLAKEKRNNHTNSRPVSEIDQGSRSRMED